MYVLIWYVHTHTHEEGHLSVGYIVGAAACSMWHDEEEHGSVAVLSGVCDSFQHLPQRARGLQGGPFDTGELAQG